MDRYAIARGEKPLTKKEIKMIADAFWDRDINQKLGGLSDIEISEKAKTAINEPTIITPNGRSPFVLRNKGYDVRVTEIKGLLQDSLEQLFKEYVKKETGRDLAYDIKKIRKEEIGKIYYQILNWGKEHAPHLLKSGWRSLNI